jgi:dihydrofolate synthase/folylpolyglutamate synthase
MTYETALAYLAGLNESGIRPGLERIEKALSFLGSPHLKFPHVLIGGTNGKGSVVSMMGSVLQKAGFLTGRYTSPHLNRFEERIVVGTDSLSPEHLTDLVDLVMTSDAELSYFEFATAMALVHFAAEKVDIALLEVGLGGRWDATNATDPILSVITSVAEDHREWLGDTIEEIAAEKSMIVRRNRSLIVNGVEPAALNVIRKRADYLSSRLILGGQDFNIRWAEPPDTVHYTGRRWDLPGLRLGLGGRFQLENAATSMAALECLIEEGFPVPEVAVIEGLATVQWPGRFQDLGGDPKILVDSAHNRPAVQALVQSLDAGQDIVWLISVLRDKDLEGMAGEMLQRGDRFVLVSLDHKRSCSLAEMQRRVPGNAAVVTAQTVEEGLTKAIAQAGKDGIVVVAGSIFLAAAVLKVMEKQNPESRSQPLDKAQGSPSTPLGTVSPPTGGPVEGEPGDRS